MITEKQLLPTTSEAESVSTNTIRSQVLNGLRRSEEYRSAFAEECIRARLTTQIRTMREHRADPWDYKRLADRLDKKVSWAYRLEDPNASIPTIPTLLKVARAFDVALDVRFVPFSAVLREATNLTPESFDVVSFEDELPDLEHEIEQNRRPASHPPSAHAEQISPLDYQALQAVILSVSQSTTPPHTVCSLASRQIGVSEILVGAKRGSEKVPVPIDSSVMFWNRQASDHKGVGIAYTTVGTPMLKQKEA